MYALEWGHPGLEAQLPGHSLKLKLNVVSNCPLKSALSAKEFAREKFVVFELCRQVCILFWAPSSLSTTTHSALTVREDLELIPTGKAISKGHLKVNLFWGSCALSRCNKYISLNEWLLLTEDCSSQIIVPWRGTCSVGGLAGPPRVRGGLGERAGVSGPLIQCQGSSHKAHWICQGAPEMLP